MRELRPIKVFAAAQAAMSSLITLRFWFGHSTAVWRVFCIVGAWAPLGAAAMFLYVRARGDREDSLAAAWMVRALGVQSILAWGVGVADFLRGPPGTRPAWDADVGGPFVLVGFALPFVLGTWTLARLLRVHRELRAGTVAPVRPGEGEVAAVPFRGLATRAADLTVTRAPVAVIPIVALGTVLAAQSVVSPLIALALAALPLAALAARSHRAFWAGLGALAWIALAVGLRRVLRAEASVLSQAMALPWSFTAAAGLFVTVLLAVRRGHLARTRAALAQARASRAARR